MNQKQVHVAVGVVLRDGHIFLTRRAAHQHQGGKWEFPGGKCEAGETVQQALVRELREELAIETRCTEPMIVIHHDYGDKQVKLDTHWVLEFDGEPESQEGLQGRWVAIDDLTDYDFPEANKPILKAISRKL